MARGRPQDPAKQQLSKQALRQAARDLLQQKPYRSISIRELAQQAGMQSAMVSYYFGSKEGLFISLLEESGEHRQKVFQRVAAEILQQPNQALALLVNNMIDLITSEPWLVRLLQDEILTQQSELRSAFLEAVPKRLSRGLLELLETLIQHNILRPDLNPHFAAASLMSNLMFPLLAEPVMSETINVNRDVIRSDAWKQHVTQVLSQGLMLNPAANHSSYSVIADRPETEDSNNDQLSSDQLNNDHTDN